MNSFEKFASPDGIFAGTDFWMLNGSLDNDEIKHQLCEMKDKGVYSFIARTYVGLQSDYPGPMFKSHLKTIIDTAKELDMKVFLQAGYMPEHVLDLPEEYSLNYLKAYRENDDIPDDETRILQKDGLVFTEYNSKTFLDMFNTDSVDFYLRRCYENMWQEFSDEYGKTIISIWVDEPSYSESYLPYPKGFDKVFFERFGYDIKENIHKLFLDVEDFQTVRYHYRKLLQDMLENAYFRMLNEWCEGHGLMASGHLMHEDRLERQIARSCATMPFYRFFDIPGIDVLCGQMNWRDNPIKPERGENYSFRDMLNTTPAQCVSAAHQTGKQHILCEMYGVATQDMTFRNQKYMFDYLAVHGINHRSVHGIFYSLHGRGKRAYPPHFNYYQPYWQDIKLMYDYVSSVSGFISLGKPQAKTLVIHPLDSAYCEYVNPAFERVTGAQASLNALRRRDKNFAFLITQLYLSNNSFELGDERTVELFGQVKNGSFAIGQMEYDAVVLPDLITLQSSTAKILKEFMNCGGKVIVLGSAPTRLDGKEDTEGILKFLEGAQSAQTSDALLSMLPEPDYRFDCEYDDRSVFIRKSCDGDESYFFLFNSDCSSSRPGVLTVNGTVRAEIWDGFERTRRTAFCEYRDGKTNIPLTLPCGGSIMLYVKKTEITENSVFPPRYTEEKLALDNRWETEREDKNVLLLEFCRYKKGNGEYSDEYPILGIHEKLTAEDYHGTLTQKFVFFSEECFDGLSLALEDAKMHGIRFNGQDVETDVTGYYRAKAFETVKLPKCQKGENVIELTRDYSPLEKMKSSIGSLFQTRKGVELESVYLLGDFAVKAVQEPERGGNLRYSRNMSIAKEPETVYGELTRAGYPFYAGTIKLSQKFEYSASLCNGERVYFSLDEINASHCHVAVNGIPCGCIHTPPYRLDITKALQKGENILEIRLVNTLRNLLGPYHRPFGEVGNHFGGGYKYPDAAWACATPEWYENRTPDTDEWTDSYLLNRLGVKGAAVICCSDNMHC